MRRGDATSLAPAGASLALLGLTYAGFSALLHRARVPARASLLPVDSADYYGLQALFVGPWLALLATLYVSVAWSLSGARARGATLREAFARLAPRYALPLWAGFVLPDLLVFLVAGVEALPRAMRLYGPVAPIAIVWTSVGPLRALARCGRARAALASVGALVLQALVGATLLR